MREVADNEDHKTIASDLSRGAFLVGLCADAVRRSTAG